MLREKGLPVPWHVQTYHRRVHYLKRTGQTGKTEERKTLPEKEKVHQT